ncbi:MAG: hypothetical protein IJU98_07495 [Synergistaceae bacterium]|nr:hypothetical protein [Synergistaceae bacterium]
MKRVLCAAVLGLLLLGGAAFGKVREFQHFSLDVPKGWKVAQKGASVRVRKEDRSASLIITIDKTNGRSIDEIAESESKKAKGTRPEKDDDGDYTFTSNGGRTQTLLSGAGNIFLMMTITGADEAEDELTAILDSLEMKDMSGAVEEEESDSGDSGGS